jgi:hypothetical protein
VLIIGLLLCPCSEERIAQLAELAPWRLCANERQMTLPPAAAAKLPWGMLAGGSWWNQRPARWLKVGNQRDLRLRLARRTDACWFSKCMMQGSIAPTNTE